MLEQLAALDVAVIAPSSAELDLRDRDATNRLFQDARPDYVFHLAARVFGIMGNMTHKGLSIYDNVLINTNVIEASRICGAAKVVSMGSGCVYPYPPPSEHLAESMIFQGEPHPSEDSYAHSKRLLLAMQKAYKEEYGIDYAFVVSGNLYGPGDSFDIENGHVIPSLVHKIHVALKTGEPFVAWGTGIAKRDFTYSTDAARALVAIMERGEGAINMGSGVVNSIREVIETLAEVSGLGVENVRFDSSKPDGQEYRYYDVSRLQGLGFRPEVSLRSGLLATYQWFSENYDTARK